MEQNIPINPGSSKNNYINNLITIGVIILAVIILGNTSGIFADSDTDEVPYYIEDTTSIWIPVNLPAGESTTITIEKVDGYSPNIDEVFNFADDFNVNMDNWIARSDGSGGNTVIDLENGKLLLGAYGDYYTSPKIAYVRSLDSYELPISIKFKSDQPFSTGEGKWWYAGFCISPMTELTAIKVNGGNYYIPYGIEVAQADDGYRETKTAINIMDRVNSETIETLYSNPDYPGTHEFQLDIFDDSTVDVYIDDVKVIYQGRHSLSSNKNYLYFIRKADQSIWNKQTFHYIYVKKATKNPPTTTITDMGTYYKIEIQNNENMPLTDFQVEISAAELDVWTSNESLKIEYARSA